MWITRAAPGAHTTARRVGALGYDPLVAPLLVTRAVGDGPIDLADVGALAFTSANGVAAFAARSAERRLPVFTVGSATAAAARATGFEEVVSAGGDVAALAGLIGSRRSRIVGEILHPAAAETIGELPARKLVVYETVETPPAAKVRATLDRMYAVLVHSPKAARVLATILAQTPAAGLRVLCLSPAVAAPLAGAPVGEIRSAALPEEQALLNLLAD